MRTIRHALPVIVASVILIACRQDMHDQPKYKPLSASTYFGDGRSARPVPAGTIARDELAETDSFHTGAQNGEFLASIPLPINATTLHRGEERFDVYCSPCHDRLGTGWGMIARRGLKAPMNLQADRIRQAPPGYIFQVITNGYGAMPDHGDQITVEDRWAIVAYVRALELSQNVKIGDVPSGVRSQLEVQQ